MSILYDQYGKTLWRADGRYYNPATGYGGANDSVQNTRYIDDYRLSQAELDALYSGNWVVTRGVDLPVDDRLSDGIEFITNTDDSEGRRKQLEDLVDQIAELDFFNKLVQASKWESLHGGGILYFEYGDDPRYELRDSQRGIPKQIWVADRWYAIPGGYYTDFIDGVDHPKRGQPKVYQITLQTTGWSRLVTAHESRCIKLGGLPLPPRLLAQNHMWGNSVVNIVNDIVKLFSLGLKSQGDTLEDFNWKTLKIENLADLIASTKKADIKYLTHAAGMAAGNHHNQSVGMHGGNTELTKHTTNVSGLTDITEQFSSFVASSFPPGIPDSLFFAAKGGALAGNAADTDVRNYYKRLSQQRKLIDAPRIRQALFMMGYDPKEYPFKFPPLEEPTQKEIVETRYMQAQTDEIYANIGALDPFLEVRPSKFGKAEPDLNQVIIDPSLNEMPTHDEEDVQEEEEPENDNTETKEEESEKKEPRADKDEDYGLGDFYTIFVSEKE